MRLTKGWEERWLLLFFCTSHDGLLHFLEDGPKEEDEIIVKRNEELWLWMKCKHELYYFQVKNEVNNMASPFLYFLHYV